MIIKKFIGGRWVAQDLVGSPWKSSPSVVVTPSEPDEWETKVECITECSKAPKDITVYLTPIVMAKIDALMKKYTSREWLGYLVGSPEKPFHIVDMVIPVQTATSASVDDIQFPKLENGMKVLGVIHSHHNMGCGFSGTDDKWINQNHDISILVSHTSMKVQVRVNVPCGAKKIMEAKPKVSYNLDFDEETFIKSAEENIRDRKIVTPYTSSRDNWYDRYCGGDFFDGYGYVNREPEKKSPQLFDSQDKELSLEEELIKEFTENSEKDNFTI